MLSSFVKCLNTVRKGEKEGKKMKKPGSAVSTSANSGHTSVQQLPSDVSEVTRACTTHCLWPFTSWLNSTARQVEGNKKMETYFLTLLVSSNCLRGWGVIIKSKPINVFTVSVLFTHTYTSARAHTQTHTLCLWVLQFLWGESASLSVTFPEARQWKTPQALVVLLPETHLGASF